MDKKLPLHHPFEHSIFTPRFEVRGAHPSEGAAINELLSSPANNHFTRIEDGTTARIFEDRILEWRETAAQGKNAFVVSCFREIDTITKTPAGTIIGFGRFNSLPMEPMIESPNGADLGLLGDTGLLIDHHLQRRGFAYEATAATIPGAPGRRGLDGNNTFQRALT
ncbi:MAG: hypothetical protein LQ340_004317 [Diploschistes diacapsis]|nr:MAG: hypothetical protein LQ340_004317 [Diploschistes diacapsis]